MVRRSVIAMIVLAAALLFIIKPITATAADNTTSTNTTTITVTKTVTVTVIEKDAGTGEGMKFIGMCAIVMMLMYIMYNALRDAF